MADNLQVTTEQAKFMGINDREVVQDGHHRVTVETNQRRAFSVGKPGRNFWIVGGIGIHPQKA